MTKQLSDPHISTRRWPRAIAVVTLSLSAVLAGCGGGNSGTTSSATHAGGAASVTTSAAASTGASTANSVSVSAKKAAATNLSGRWSGQYNGTFQGTFTLTWRQTGNTLKGTIKPLHRPRLCPSPARSTAPRSPSERSGRWPSPIRRSVRTFDVGHLQGGRRPRKRSLERHKVRVAQSAVAAVSGRRGPRYRRPRRASAPRHTLPRPRGRAWPGGRPRLGWPPRATAP